MKFTVLGHAGLFIETKTSSLLIDPWLIGSCYWRSWWNYPPVPEALLETFIPDYIYITHLHWDHFHSPSLKRFDQKTPILVPRAHFDRMIQDLNSIGFHNVQELTHGASYFFGSNLKLTSYQFGLSLDSALVVDTGEGVLLDANDCKLMGLPLKRVAARHPKIDFVFKSHSSASSYPFCVSSDWPEHLCHRPNEDYAREFLAFAEFFNARYAIPFASNHCFLHKETKHFNNTIVSPFDVKSYFDKHRTDNTICEVLLPGDSWSTDSGFSIAKQNYFTERASHLQNLEQRYADKLERCYAKENMAVPDWESFKLYFSKLLSVLPLGFGMIFPAKVLFHVKGAREANWLIDFKTRKIFKDVDTSIPHDIQLETHAGILRDCCQKKMFSVFTASKRLHYHLKTKSALRYYFIFNMLMDMYESEYFPLRFLFRKRFISNWLRRWREILFYSSVLFRLLRRAQVKPIDYLSQKSLSKVCPT